MNQDFEFFKIIFLLVGVLLIARLVTLFAGPHEKKRESKCDIHKWSINPTTEKLQCIGCGFVAGTHSTDKGDY